MKYRVAYIELPCLIHPDLNEKAKRLFIGYLFILLAQEGRET